MENNNLLLNPDTTTFLLSVFLCLIVSHGVYSLINRSKGNTANRADMALSLGILGTFLGIVAGLLGFDVKDIQGSIPQLLSGLQYAFITSIAGMFSSIIIKLSAAKGEVSGSAASPESIQTELRGINGTLQNNNNLRAEESNELRDEFRKLISGDNDTSLVNQIKLMKGDLIGQLKENKVINESGFKNLELKFTELGENIAELSSEAMVEALQQAIVEFNKQLADQLGDNFKELNAGVKNLLEWQIQYKGTILEMQDSTKILINQLGDATTAIENISVSLEPIPQTVQSIQELFANTETSIGLLLSTLESFDNMRERATNAFPVIEENITAMTDGFSQTINNIGENLENMSSEFSTSITENSNSIRENSNSVSESMIDSSERLNEFVGNFNESITNSSERIDQLVHQSCNNIEAASQALSESVTHNQETVNQNVEAASQALSESITENQQAVNQNIEVASQALSVSVTHNQETVNQNIVDANQALSVSITENQQTVNQNIQNAAQSSEALINQTIAALDEQMQVELTHSINGLGTALASLSRKFVDDYAPLTARMSELISVGEQIRN